MNPLTIKHTTFGDGVPKICIPITGRTENEILKAAEKISRLPADVAEWRADYYEAVTEPGAVLPVLAALRKRLPDTLLLFTFRTKKEGGDRALSDEAYLELCRTAAGSGLADLLDLELFTGAEPAQTKTDGQTGTDRQTELSAQTKIGVQAEPAPDRRLLEPVISFAQARGCRVILSSHDFQRTPPGDELLRRLSLMEALGADLAKAAVMPNCGQDVLTLLSATRTAADTLSCPVITMSMGKLGAVSRVSGALTGSCLTFGTAGEASAPGQLPAGILKQILDAL